MENLSDSHTDYTEVAAYLKKHIDYAGCLLVELAYGKKPGLAARSKQPSAGGRLRERPAGRSY